MLQIDSLSRVMVVEKLTRSRVSLSDVFNRLTGEIDFRWVNYFRSKRAIKVFYISGA
jgi:hypothetical protein